MIISVEISYYPLADNYASLIDDFIDKVSQKGITLEIGTMSTIAIGEFDCVMGIINGAIKTLMQDYPSVFTLKLSNSCPIV